jgi:hypothetical protein
MDASARMLGICGAAPSGPRFREPVIVAQEVVDSEIARPRRAFALGSEAACPMSCEPLIDPGRALNRPLRWPWQRAREHIGKLPRLGQAYTGRRGYCRYKPATGRANGTGHSFFATVGLTIEDHRLQIATESLLWQERLDWPVRSPGAESGFSTSMGELVLPDA